MYLSQGLDVGLIGWTEKLAQGSKAPPFSAKTCPSQQSTSLEDHKRPLATSVQQRAERSQREAGRPGLVCFQATQATPTPGGNQGRPHKGGGQMAKILGRPAYERPAGPTLQPLRLWLCVKVKHNCHNWLQPTPRASPAQNRPWKGYKKSTHPCGRTT